VPLELSELGWESSREVSADERETSADEALLLWLRAARFRRAAERAVRRHGLTFSQWRVLHGLRRVVGSGDAVSQQTIGRYIEMDENTLSAVTRRLIARDLISWGPDAWGWSYRLFVTDRGIALLNVVREDVVRAARLAELASARGAVKGL
jgi:DNA-binding MarR family transcriptional regulator